MISQKLSKEIEKFNSVVSGEHELINVLESLSSAYQSFKDKILEISGAGDSNQTFRATGIVKTETINSAQSSIRQTKFSTLAKSAEKIKNAINFSSADKIYELPRKIEVFIDHLDEQLHAHSLATSINLIESAHILITTLQEIQSLEFTLQETTQKKNTSNPVLTIYLPGHTDLPSFSQKISSLSAIVDICCGIFRMSATEGEVEIGKIESGSFFAEISANPLVISLATIVITKGTDYLFSQIGSSRRTETLRESSDALEKIFGIRSFMSEQKMDTTALDEEIKKSSLLLAKQLSQLIDGQQEIEINDKKLNYTQNAIPHHRSPALEDKSEG